MTVPEQCAMSPKGDKGIGHASSACTLFHLKTKRRHISYSNTEHMCLFSKTRSYDVHTWFGGKCQKICRLYLIWFSVTLRAISQSYNSGLVSGGITKNITEQEKKEGIGEKRKPIKIKVQGYSSSDHIMMIICTPEYLPARHFRFSWVTNFKI